MCAAQERAAASGSVAVVEAICGGLVPRLVKPEGVEKLYRNYRTHSGVLSLANAIIEQIEFFFPASIDTMPHDLGVFEGPKPLFLDCDYVELLCLLAGGGSARVNVEFGAYQGACFFPLLYRRG